MIAGAVKFLNPVVGEITHIDITGGVCCYPEGRVEQPVTAARRTIGRIKRRLGLRIDRTYGQYNRE